MGKNQSQAELTNIVQYDTQGNIFFVSGSTTLMSISSSGQITTTGIISGSSALSSSFAVSSSQSSNANSLGNQPASAYATTGSNAFNGTQNIIGGIIATGAITAQTLNVQQVTSSIVYSSGSNVFGNSLSNTQQITGSLLVTGSIASFTGNISLATSSLNWNYPLLNAFQIRNSSFYAYDNYELGIQTNAYYDSNWRYISTGVRPWQMSFGNDTAIKFSTAASGSAGSTFTWTELMRITPSGSVGIGTNNPLTILDVKQSATGTATVNSAFRDSSTNGNALQIWNGNNEARFRAVYYGTPSDQNITFYTITSGGSEGERMRITSAGNVGIGTNSPGYPLEVYKDTTGYATIHVRNPNATANSGASIRLYSSGYDNMPAEIINKPDATGGTLVFNIRRASGTYYDAVTFKGNGNVGIGVTSPTGQLSIINQVNNGTNPVSSYAATQGVEGQNFFNGYYASNSDALGPYPRYFDIVSVGSPDGSNGGSNIRFFTNPVATSSPAVERMRVTSAGTVYIGTTPTSNVNGTLVVARDQVYPNDVNPASLILCGVSNTNRRMTLGYDTTNQYGYIVAGDYGVQWTSLYLQKTGGAVYAGTLRIDNNSDRRVKRDITSVENALDTILKLQGRKFYMIDEDNILRYGFVAQEVQPHLSDFVTESTREHKDKNVHITNLLTLETSGAAWAALLVEAIKELKSELDAAKAEIEILKTK